MDGILFYPHQCTDPYMFSQCVWYVPIAIGRLQNTWSYTPMCLTTQAQGVVLFVAPKTHMRDLKLILSDRAFTLARFDPDEA